MLVGIQYVTQALWWYNKVYVKEYLSNLENRSTPLVLLLWTWTVSMLQSVKYYSIWATQQHSKTSNFHKYLINCICQVWPSPPKFKMAQQVSTGTSLASTAVLFSAKPTALTQSGNRTRPAGYTLIHANYTAIHSKVAKMVYAKQIDHFCQLYCYS